MGRLLTWSTEQDHFAVGDALDNIFIGLRGRKIHSHGVLGVRASTMAADSQYQVRHRRTW